MSTTEAPETTRAVQGAEPQPADVFVVFGITGDLAKVMTFHSLYRLEQRGLLDCPIVGVAVDDWTVDQLVERARESIEGTGETLDPKVFDRFAARLSYVSGDFTDAVDVRARGRGDRRRRDARLLPRDPAVPLRHGRQGPRRGRADEDRAGRRREAVRPRPGLGTRSSPTSCTSTSTSRSSSGSTTTSGRWASRRSSTSASRTRCSSRSGTGTTSSRVQITMAEDFGVEDRGHFYDPGRRAARRRRQPPHAGRRSDRDGAARRRRPEDAPGREGLALPRDQAGRSGALRARPVRRLPRDRRRRSGLDAPRRTPRSASRSTTGAGPASRSSSARASGCRSRRPRSGSSSSTRRVSASRRSTDDRSPTSS